MNAFHGLTADVAGPCAECDEPSVHFKVEVTDKGKKTTRWCALHAPKEMARMLDCPCCGESVLESEDYGCAECNDMSCGDETHQGKRWLWTDGQEEQCEGCGCNVFVHCDPDYFNVEADLTCQGARTSHISVNQLYDAPGARFKAHGPNSGEELRERYLAPNLEPFDDGLEQFLVVDLDGLMGHPPSWLEEAFGGLVRQLGADVQERITIVCEDPKVVELAERMMKEAAEGQV